MIEKVDKEVLLNYITYIGFKEDEKVKEQYLLNQFLVDFITHPSGNVYIAIDGKFEVYSYEDGMKLLQKILTPIVRKKRINKLLNK